MSDKTIIKIDLNGLSSRDTLMFLDFYRYHKQQPILDVVKVWDEFADNINQYVFTKTEKI